MKMSLLSAVFALAAISSAVAATPGETGKVVRTVKWSEVPLPADAVVQNKPGASPTLLIKGDRAKTLPLWKLDDPGISKKCYALRGKMRYKDVSGIGYLEMWNEFPAEKPDVPKPRYFSRTLAATGPLSSITGSSDWREVYIPFDATQSAELPKALELNLRLEGTGEVEITSLVLMEFEDAAAMWNGVVTAEALPPRLPQTVIGRYITGAMIVGGLALACVIVWAVTRRSRQLAEERRMKAMDAMP